MAIIQNIVQPRTIYIHKETTNQSFLDMHYYLKEKGIQNNDFFLALLDVGLAGVNPRDPSLPPHIKARILNECRSNYWYYLREVVAIPEQGGTVDGGVKYKLHRGNLAMNFLFVLNFNMYVELPRQFGKTVAAVCRYLWVYNFGTSNSEIMFMHKDHPGSKGNLKKLKDIRDALPSYLQLSSTVSADGKKLKVPNTVVMIQHPFNNNKIITYPSARTKDAANNLGRGATMPCQYYDEIAFMPYNKEVLLAAIPAYSTASETAQRNRAPYGLLMTSTPGDLLTASGQYAYNIRNKATPWREEYYDMNYEELLGLKNSNNQSSLFFIRYTYQQLGRGNDYFRKMKVEMNSEWSAIRREVLLEWAEIAEDCPFAQEDLDKIKLHIKDPIRTLFFGRFNQYQFNIYEDIDLSYPPIIGVDVSGATFNDSSAITIIDSHTTRVCATLNCNYIPADDLADVIYQLVTVYMPNAIVAVERNGGFGTSVIQRLVKTTAKKNLYWEVKDKVIEESFNGVRMDKRAKKVKVYGIDSTKSVRARLIEILMERVMYHKDKFVSEILLNEMQSMQVKKNGKVEHSDKSHDDQVFSYLMALYVWYDGKNLAENFGISKNTLRTDDNEELEELELEESLEKRSKVDINNTVLSDNTELAKDLEWVEKDMATYRTSSQLSDSQSNELIMNRMKNVYSINNAKDSDYGVYLDNYSNQSKQFIYLGDDVFINDDEKPNRDPRLVGNLSDYYNLIQ